MQPNMAGVQMIKDKKLASPIKICKFIGDKDIPAQMTEERAQLQMEAPTNTMVTLRGDYHPILEASEGTTVKASKFKKREKSIHQKNKNNFKKLQSNLKKKQHKLVTNILSEALDYDDSKENQCTKNLTSEFNDILDNSVTINLNQLDVQP